LFKASVKQVDQTSKSQPKMIILDCLKSWYFILWTYTSRKSTKIVCSEHKKI